MGEHRSGSTCNKIAGGNGHRSLTLVLLWVLVTFLVTPLVYSATTHRTTAEMELASAIPSLIPAHEEWGGEPIAYVGHGGFFDHNGRQIVPTAELVAMAQSWYRKRLLAGLGPDQKAELSAFERRLGEDLNLAGQAGLVVQQRSLDWLIAHSPRTTALELIQGKLNALTYRLSWQLPDRDDLERLQNLEPFRLDPKLEARLRLPEFNPGIAKTATTNFGPAYTNECMAAGVPIPPSIGVLDPAGLNGWRSLGFIPTGKQFIEGTPAEVRVFENPKGMCIALPRYTDQSLTTVMLDGVICLSKTTSKVCFWDNQRKGVGFSFPAGTQIPIGASNTSVDKDGRYQAGGVELVGGDGGVCTDCHAGENPYIIHPNANLGTVLMGDLNRAPLGLPTFGPSRYDPIVGATWPQNQLSHSQPLVPSVCRGCHTLGGTGGRFPHLSTGYNGNPGYCKTVLAKAIKRTMPPLSPGSEEMNPDVVDFQAWCDKAASTGPSNRGDPHLTTTNGISYDFQAAGEFTALRNSDTGFELQTRQTPVPTTFTPDANAYTGLASCVSLNTAAAVRVGSHRISYQPSSGSPGTAEQMQLRIDGKLTTLPTSGSVNLGGNNRIARAASGGGIEIGLGDGTRVIITPNYWASQGYWLLDIEVLTTPAREGTMGNILPSNWLPLAPDGSSFGPAPAGLAARHSLLNGRFADAWRVTSSTSLFDYAPGTSTATFTNRNWPPPSGSSCKTIPGKLFGEAAPLPVSPMDPATAQSLCNPVKADKAAYDNCVFDLTVTGNAAMADGYRMALQLRGTVATLGCSGVQLAASPASSAVVGTPVALAASPICATGITPQYRFWVYTFYWKIVRDWSPSATFGWSTAGLRAGTYRLLVEVRSDARSLPQGSGILPFTLSP